MSQGKITKIDQNLEINSRIIEYNIDDGQINFVNEVKIEHKFNNLNIYSDNINYNIKKQIISSDGNSKIIDEYENIYTLDKFEYSIQNKFIKLFNTKIIDKDN